MYSYTGSGGGDVIKSTLDLRFLLWSISRVVDTTTTSDNTTTSTPTTNPLINAVLAPAVSDLPHSPSLKDEIIASQLPSMLSNCAWTRMSSPDDTHSASCSINWAAESRENSLISVRKVTAVGDSGKHLKPALVIKPISNPH